MYKFYKTFSFGIFSLIKTSKLQQLKKIEKDAINIFINRGIQNGCSYKNIKSQIGQDLFVLETLNWKKNGFFIEFGASDGITNSNTYLLEKDFSWKGVLCDPCLHFKEKLKINRNNILDFNCVWKKSHENIEFLEFDDREFSGIKKTQKKYKIFSKRKYKVKTISLNDLLKKHNSPNSIDYLSIDTEGSEYEILKAFDFKKYKISIITCEHNFSKDRDKIFNLLNRNGFQRMYEGISRWDDWYVNLHNIKFNND